MLCGCCAAVMWLLCGCSCARPKCACACGVRVVWCGVRGCCTDVPSQRVDVCAAFTKHPCVACVTKHNDKSGLTQAGGADGRDDGVPVLPRGLQRPGLTPRRCGGAIGAPLRSLAPSWRRGPAPAGQSSPLTPLASCLAVVRVPMGIGA
jgi:hypothetical protein